MKLKALKTFAIILLLISFMPILSAGQTNLTSTEILEAEKTINFVMTDYPYVVTLLTNSKEQIRQLKKDNRRKNFEWFKTGGCLGFASGFGFGVWLITKLFPGLKN